MRGNELAQREFLVNLNSGSEITTARRRRNLIGARPSWPQRSRFSEGFEFWLKRLVGLRLLRPGWPVSV